jgi:hypothetical protein
MTVEKLYTFRILDEFNEWAVAIQVNAEDEEQARRRAEHIMFARRTTSSGELGDELGGRIDLMLVP